jgi:hypothetical protein
LFRSPSFILLLLPLTAAVAGFPVASFPILGGITLLPFLPFTFAGLFCGGFFRTVVVVLVVLPQFLDAPIERIDDVAAIKISKGRAVPVRYAVVAHQFFLALTAAECRLGCGR